MSATVSVPVADVDQQTRDEMAVCCEYNSIPCYCPACDGASDKHGDQPCNKTATAVVHAYCISCPCGLSLLLCDGHARDALNAAEVPGRCVGCGESRAFVVAVDRL